MPNLWLSTGLPEQTWTGICVHCMPKGKNLSLRTIGICG